MKRRDRIVIAGILLAVVTVVGMAGVWGWLTYNRLHPLEVSTAFGSYSDNESIHGFGVLAQLMQQQGQQVARTGVLTSQLDRYDLLIWTHKGPQLPNNEALEKVEEWMGNGGTVVFIGHDYSAARDYWRCVYQQSSGAERGVARWAYRLEQLKSLTETKLDLRSELTSPGLRSDYHDNAANRWMEVAGDRQPKSGHWESVDSKIDWSQAGQRPDPTANHLATSGPQPILVRSWLKSRSNHARVLATVEQQGQSIPTMWREQRSQRGGLAARDLWVISHPVFLVNFGILRPENAPLRDAFLAEISDKDRVLFLETGPGPVLMSTTPNDRIDQSWAWMTKGPFPLFVLHTVLLSLVFCFARFPVFGRPRRIDFEPRNDFGQHLVEVGRLLRARKLEAFAREKLEHYFQVIRRGSRKKPS